MLFSSTLRSNRKPLKFTIISRQILQPFLNRNAIASDNISVLLIGRIDTPLLTHITFLIINAIISTGQFPNCWKKVVVIPLLKRNYPTDLSGLRPITILHGLLETVEIISKDQINTFVKERGIITSEQSGFRSQHSTSTDLLSINDDIFSAIVEGILTYFVLLNFSKPLTPLIATLCVKISVSRFFYGPNHPLV